MASLQPISCIQNISERDKWMRVTSKGEVMSHYVRAHWKMGQGSGLGSLPPSRGGR